MNRLNIALFSLTLVFSFLFSTILPAQGNKAMKKRVAVFLFEDKSGGRSGWYGGKSVGEGITDMLTTEMVKSGKYRVIERDQLENLLKEQDLGMSGIVSPQSAAQIGKVLGVELAVLGSVTEFGHQKENSGMRLGGSRLGLGKNSAVVAIDLRLVNTSTGEILLAENVRKTKSGLSGSISLKKFGFNNRKNFDNSLVGKCTRKAVEEVIDLIGQNSNNMTWQAKVITMNGNKVYINSGKTNGVELGESFKVFRKGEALIDPDTGLNLGSVDSEIGTIKVIDNSVGEGKASICTIVSGAEFAKGDLVKLR